MNTIRLKKIQAQIQNPILIKKKENLRYLTGGSFEHIDGYLLVKKNDVVFFGSGLEKVEGIKKTDSLRNIGKYLKSKETLEIFGEFTYAEGRYIQAKINKGTKLKITVARDPIDVMRAVKDGHEIELVRKSMQIVEQVFAQVKQEIKRKNITERQLAHFIETAGITLGAEAVSFPAIVASGANAAVPHHVAGNKKLLPHESIILDFGFKYKGYCSDFTRTIFLKSAPKKLADAYNQTELAYRRSFEAAVTGVKAEILHELTVKTLEEKKISKYFIHSLGHGTGLEIHELPNLSPNSKDILANGMVFSIEPGVYFPNRGGIRIEDLVYLEKGICKKFINIPTDLASNVV